MSNNSVARRSWLTANTLYQGFPIYLRRPNILVSEYPSLSPHYPKLLVLTHSLAHVKSDGLPEAEYNDSLRVLDSELIDTFHAGDFAIAALVETFAGKRTYYFYARKELDIDSLLDRFAERFPSEKIQWKTTPDPGWTLLSRYARDFSFA